MVEKNKPAVIYRDSLDTALLFAQDVKFPNTQYQVVYPERSGMQHPPEELPFQVGTLADDGVNGCTNELLIAAVKHRIEQMNAQNPTEFNVQAIRGLTYALEMLEQRDKFRRRTGISNTTLTEKDLHKAEQQAVSQIINRLSLGF